MFRAAGLHGCSAGFALAMLAVPAFAFGLFKDSGIVQGRFRCFSNVCDSVRISTCWSLMMYVLHLEAEPSQFNCTCASSSSAQEGVPSALSKSEARKPNDFHLVQLSFFGLGQRDQAFASRNCINALHLMSWDARMWRF